MIKKELIDFFRAVISERLDAEKKNRPVKFIEYPVFNAGDSEFTDFVIKNKSGFDEVMILLLALVPHVLPDFLNNLVLAYFPAGGDFPQFGGVKGKNHRSVLPTGETVLFVLAGSDLERRAEVARVFDEGHLFARKNILYLDNVEKGEPRMAGKLILEDDYIDLFTTGKISKPRLSADFPAERISTGLEWTDLVLQEKTLDGIREIEIWLKHNETLLTDWNLRNKIKPGFRVLFYGPPGTGKTMTACLLGKYTNRDVYRIDLSTVVSKYIGETEKNLSKLFDKAANKDWILFFDEADAIFGKRTGVRDAHDKYANQEVSYLLQRIENHAGLVILASNMKGNIDPSFTRRFNSIIEFENPGSRERMNLWQNYIPKGKLDESVQIREIAHKYDITGANIVNAIHFAGLRTFEKKSIRISKNDLLEGIEKEYLKEGKIFLKG
ncbi:MAG TPA: AAA family ATPase [Prolixibacteraceae bacterium]|nr:AAA family ATPase [Prolixibacteraceae bacterium]